MKRIVAIAAGLLTAAACTPLLQSSTGEEAPLLGFSAESSRAERQWEEKFKAIPKPENLREYMRRLTVKYDGMDLADASLVAVGERLGLLDVITLDRRDFSRYRTRARQAFTNHFPARA